jgi:phage shock protein A
LEQQLKIVKSELEQTKESNQRLEENLRILEGKFKRFKVRKHKMASISMAPESIDFGIDSNQDDDEFEEEKTIHF